MTRYLHSCRGMLALALAATALALCGCRRTESAAVADRSPRHSRGRHLIPFETSDGKAGYVDETGRIAIPAVFGAPEAFDDATGLAVVSFEDGGCGFIDKSGREVFKQRFGWAGRFCDGLACVNYSIRGSKWGFIDRSGQTVIGPRFDELGFFSHGLCETVLDGEACIINRQG